MTLEDAPSVSMSNVERASSAAIAAKLMATIAATAGLSPVTVTMTALEPAVATVR